MPIFTLHHSSLKNATSFSAFDNPNLCLMQCREMRTALHLAAADNQFEVVEYLLSRGLDPNPVDRWDGTPLKDAKRGKHKAIIELLTKKEPLKRIAS